jgi:hypothetical protein
MQLRAAAEDLVLLVVLVEHQLSGTGGNGRWSACLE